MLRDEDIVEEFELNYERNHWLSPPWVIYLELTVHAMLGSTPYLAHYDLTLERPKDNKSELDYTVIISVMKENQVTGPRSLAINVDDACSMADQTL